MDTYNKNLFILPKIDRFREPEYNYDGIEDLFDDDIERYHQIIDEFISSHVEHSAPEMLCDDNTTPCGCIGANVDLYRILWYGPQLFVPQHPAWENDPVCRYCSGPISCWKCWTCIGCCRCGKSMDCNWSQKTNSILGNDGIEDVDICWCAVQSKDCMACEPLFNVLNTDGSDPEQWNYDATLFFDALKHNGNFSYRVFFLQKERREDEWCDSFACIKYHGPFKRPRTQHVLYYSAIAMARHTITGPFVPRCVYANGFCTDDTVNNVINGFETPVVELSGNTIPKLTTLASQAVHRLYDLLDEDDKKFAGELLRIHLASFRTSEGYLLPIPAVKVPPTYNNLKLAELVTAQGDEDTPAGEISITQDTEFNTTLAESTDTSVAYVAQEQFDIMPWITDSKHEYPDLTGRWTKAFSFQWTTSQAQGSIIQTFDLPLEAIQAFVNSPNALPWKQHAFYRADQEIKIQVNSQPAQSGYLAFGVMYNASEATAIGGRVDHAANIVQMPHMRISAGASNSGVIQIPFVRQFPVGCVLDNNFDVPQYVATMFVTPLLQLRTGPDGPSTVDVTVMIRFPRCEFYGQRVNADIVTAQGWSKDLTQDGDVESNPGPFLNGILGAITGAASTIKGVGSSVAAIGSGVSGVANAVGSFGSAASGIIKGVEGMLRPLFPKRDADRPQLIIEPVNLYAQQNTSYSLATGTNNVKLLQLQAENMTSHPPGLVPEDDQFNNRFILDTFGMVDYFQWSAGSGSGTLLYSLPVTPLKTFTTNTMSAEVYPTPMAALSSFYGGYHGDMEMRLTFAISKFHSGRVFIVFSPDVAINFDDIGSYYNVLLDIQDQSVYTFKIPYQVPTPYAPLLAVPQGDSGRFLTPANNNVLSLTYGVVSIFVENELRVMQTAAPTIDVLVELRAAENFHLQLPVGGVFQSIPTVTATAQGDERQDPRTTNPAPRAILPTWAAQLNESYDCRDVVKRYTPWFDIQSPPLNPFAGINADAAMWSTLNVYHIPVPSFLGNIDTPPVDVVSVEWINTNQFTQDLGPMATELAHERINLATNNSISFRVPWTNYASMLSNSINPANVRPNQMAPYCNGRVVVIIQNAFAILRPANSTGNMVIRWDVTSGSASRREGGYYPDIVTLLHDGFRFTKSDFNYQLDITPGLTPDGNSNTLNIRCHRALGDGGNFYVFQGFPKMVGRFFNTFNAIGGTTPTRGNLARQRSPMEREWVRDLTEDGDVEANPGPPSHSKHLDSDDDSDISDRDHVLTEDESEELGRGRMAGTLKDKIWGYCKHYLRMSVSSILKLFKQVHYALDYLGSLPGISRVGELVTTVRQLDVVVRGLDKVSSSVDKLTAQIQSTKESVGNFITGVKSGEPESVGDFVSHGIEYTALILNVWNSKSIGMTLLNVAALLSKMGLGRFLVHRLVDSLSTRAEADDGETEREYSSIIITGILSALGLCTADYRREGFFKRFLTSVSDFFRNGYNVKKFLDSHFRFISDLCTWIKSKIFGRVESKGLTTDLLAWCERVHTLTEVYNYDTMLNDPEFAQDILALQDEAFEFDQLFITANRRPPNQYSIYRTRLQKSVDLLGQQGTLQRSKPVPFCIWVYGKSGCGKSHVCDAVLTEIGLALGVDSANAIYTRSPDVEFWNNYTGQKLISWQDFAKVNRGETYRKQVSELSSVIEPTPFNPPQAALEDKKKISDAWVVYVSSNHAFPDVQDIGMVESALFYRRRHALVHMRLKESVVKEYKEKYDILLEEKMQRSGQTVYFSNLIKPEDFEERGSYFHVEFGFHRNGISEEPPTRYMGYDEFLSELTEKAVKHRKHEIAGCKTRREVYARLRQTKPTGREFREHAEKLADELAHQTATAQAGDRALKNLGPRLDAEGIQDFEEAIGMGAVRLLEVRVADHNLCGVVFENGQLIRRVCAACVRITRPGTVEEAYEDSIPQWKQGLTELHAAQEGTIPSSAPNYTPLDYIRQVYNGVTDRIFKSSDRSLPDGYVHWSELIPVCCHNRRILDLANYELVRDKVELVLDLSLIKTISIPCNILHWIELIDVRRWRNESYGCKVILPSVCEQSKFIFWDRFVSRDEKQFRVGFGSHGSVAFSQLTLGQVLSPWVCDAVTKPKYSFYRLSKDTLQFLINGTFVTVEDKESQVSTLNYLKSIHGNDSVSFCNTFFYWQNGGKHRVTRAYALFNAAYKDLTTVWSHIRIGIAMVAGVYAIYRLIRYSGETAEVQASQSGDIRKTPHSTIPRIVFPQTAPTVTTAQGDEKFSKIYKSFCRISKGQVTMYGVRLCSVYVLVPKHLLWYEGDYSVELINNGVWSEPFAFASKAVEKCEWPDLDLAICKFAALPAASNIVNYFTTRAQGATLRSESLALTLSDTTFRTRDIRIDPYRNRLTYDNESFKGEKNTNLVGWKYHVGVDKLKCGTLIYSNGLLCGMHVAGNVNLGIGYAISLCKEVVQDGLKSLGATEIDMRISKPVPKTIEGEVKMQPLTRAVSIPIGKASIPLHYPGKTNLEPSLIHGELDEPFRFPAAQKAETQGECLGYDIVMQGCEKQFNPPKPIEQDKIKKISDYLIEKIVPVSVPLVATDEEPLSIGQAIAGIDGVPLMSSMKLNTSIGWPLGTEYPLGSKKKDIIRVDRENGSIDIDQTAYMDYVTANDCRKIGTCAETVFMDFPKDELLKRGKQTRLINGAPLHHTLDMRRYLMEFFAAITLITNKIAVGIDVHSNDWVVVHGGTDAVVDEDYKAFGPGFHSEWLEVAKRLAIAWCRKWKKINSEYEMVVHCLFEELRGAYHIAGDLIYQTYCGSPSGAYATDRINSIANLCYHCYCYEEKYGTLTGFWNHYCLVYGDDTRREELAYTGDEFQECMRSVGIVVERDKSGTTSFLKRRFVPFKHKGMEVMLAPLPRPIVGDILNWVRRPYASKIDALQETVGSYLSEIFHHGPEVYNNSRSEIQAILAKHGKHPELPTFDDLFRQKYLSDGLWPVFTTSGECAGTDPSCRKPPERQGNQTMAYEVPHEAEEQDAYVLGG